MAIHTPNQATFSPFLKTLQVFIFPILLSLSFFKPAFFFTPQTLEFFTPDAAWQPETVRKGFKRRRRSSRLQPLQLFCLKKDLLEPTEAMLDAGVTNPLHLCGVALLHPCPKR